MDEQRRAEILAWAADWKAREKARKAAKRQRRVARLEQDGLDRQPRVYPLVRGAVLQLLAELGPSSDRDLVDAYLGMGTNRGWPDVAPQTVRQARAQLVHRERVAAAGTATSKATGRIVTLWGLTEPTSVPVAGREPMWGDE